MTSGLHDFDVCGTTRTVVLCGGLKECLGYGAVAKPTG